MLVNVDHNIDYMTKYAGCQVKSCNSLYFLNQYVRYALHLYEMHRKNAPKISKMNFTEFKTA